MSSAKALLSALVSELFAAQRASQKKEAEARALRKAVDDAREYIVVLVSEFVQAEEDEVSLEGSEDIVREALHVSVSTPWCCSLVWLTVSRSYYSLRLLVPITTTSARCGSPSCTWPRLARTARLRWSGVEPAPSLHCAGLLCSRMPGRFVTRLRRVPGFQLRRPSIRPCRP